MTARCQPLGGGTGIETQRLSRGRGQDEGRADGGSERGSVVALEAQRTMPRCSVVALGVSQRGEPANLLVLLVLSFLHPDLN